LDQSCNSTICIKGESMYVHQTSLEVIVQAPAKVNLFFEVLGKRPDGFHEIESLMCPITIFDSITFSQNQDSSIAFDCYNSFGQGKLSQTGEIPKDSSNLAVRAVELLRQQAGIRAGAKLGLIKRIPSAAGLGGGSSDAAAALAAANIGWKLNWPNSELTRLAENLGSDVPFFLVGGNAICRGRGEQIEPVDSSFMLYLVVVQPPVGLATVAVYKACQSAEYPISVMPLVRALNEGNANKAGKLLFNRLQKPAAELTEWIDRLDHEFNKLDCLGHAMTGSGSSYYGLCRNARHARRIVHRLHSLNVGNVFAVRTCR